MNDFDAFAFVVVRCYFMGRTSDSCSIRKRNNYCPLRRSYYHFRRSKGSELTLLPRNMFVLSSNHTH